MVTWGACSPSGPRSQPSAAGLWWRLIFNPKLEKGITAAWRSPNGGGNSKTGWELQNRAWLPPIDRQAHDTHAQFFLPINFSANSAPQLILKILLVVSITVNLMSYYTMLQKMLTPKPTPHLTLTLTSEIGCTAGLALKRKLQFRR